MKISPVSLRLVLTFVLSVATSRVMAQGNLTPTNSPAPSMKTLSQVEPRIDILTLPGHTGHYNITQPGSYFLSANITNLPYQGTIEINTNDVTIDLHGFTVYATGVAYGIISISPCNRVHIYNGKIVTSYVGVDFYTYGFVTNLAMEDVQITATTNTAVTGLHTTEGAMISRCLISGFKGIGNYGLGGGDNCLVDHCKLDNNYAGISLGNHSIVTDCMIRQCGGGISVNTNSIIRNNEIYATTNWGISVNACSIIENNNCNFCSGGAGISTLGSNNRIVGNQAHFNLLGIYCGTSTTNFVAGNFAHGNSSGNFILSSAIAGPVVNGVGTATNHPWANFSY